MSKLTQQEAEAAIKARANGLWHDPALLKAGPVRSFAVRDVEMIALMALEEGRPAECMFGYRREAGLSSSVNWDLRMHMAGNVDGEPLQYDEVVRTVLKEGMWSMNVMGGYCVAVQSAVAIANMIGHTNEVYVGEFGTRFILKRPWQDAKEGVTWVVSIKWTVGSEHLERTHGLPSYSIYAVIIDRK